MPIDDFRKTTELAILGTAKVREFEIINDKIIVEDDPIPFLAYLLMLEAEAKKATSIVLEFDNGKISVKHDISGKIIEQAPPPGFLWANLFNIFIRYSGNEYWEKGDVKGVISLDRLSHKWEMSATSDHKKIILNKIES